MSVEGDRPRCLPPPAHQGDPGESPRSSGAEADRPASAGLDDELELLPLGPLMLGDVRHTFDRYIHYNEAARFVLAADVGEAEFASKC